MTSATDKRGDLTILKDCYIVIPNYSGMDGTGKITFRALPDISDGKSASYSDEVIMGRSFPLKTFSHGENRAISFTIHFISLTTAEINQNKMHLRALESCVYPREKNGMPFIPPVICRIRCGNLLSDGELCVVLKSYSVKFPTDIVWDSEQYFPLKFDVETSWEVVYRTSDLPGQARILSLGR